MAAKTPAGCAHRETELLAYVGHVRAGKRGYAVVMWCADCGAVSRGVGGTQWQAPKGPTQWQAPKGATPKAKGRAPRK